jgi:hypothetical protein
MVRQTLLHFGIAAAEIERLSDTVRDELYQPFQSPHSDTALLNRLRHARQTLEIVQPRRSYATYLQFFDLAVVHNLHFNSD